MLETDTNLWYKNAIIYAVDINRFNDSNGDGRGDLVGLTKKIGYLAELGVTCLWLLPFYPTTGWDNGYDVTNYIEIDQALGSFEDFSNLIHEAGKHSIRIVVDLVVDHTSTHHPWFQAARRNPTSHYHDYYVWANPPPPVEPGKGPMFPGQQVSVWNYDEVADEYYHHRFYHFEPDLNTGNPKVQEEIWRILDFWLSFGVSGFRVDAANHLIEDKGIKNTRPENPHSILRQMRAVAEEHESNPLLLGEVDEPPEKLAAFFGDGDELNMLFNFALNNYIFLALVRQTSKPINQALQQLPQLPAAGQWANFLRNLDELDLERLPKADREEVLQQLAPKEKMRIFNRGARRRMAPMLNGNRDHLECAYSLLFSMPGTPVIIYGDEIGIGEDLSQEGRNAVRVPMQWSSKKNAGFSSASSDELLQPVVHSGPFSYKKINVADQKKDPDSLLNWFKQLIQVRRQCPELGYGSWRIIDVESPHVFAHRCMWKEGMVVAVHNLSDQKQEITLDLRDQRGRQLQELFGADSTQQPLTKGTYKVQLNPYGYKWYRVTGERPTE